MGKTAASSWIRSGLRKDDLKLSRGLDFLVRSLDATAPFRPERDRSLYGVVTLLFLSAFLCTIGCKKEDEKHESTKESLHVKETETSRDAQIPNSVTPPTPLGQKHQLAVETIRAVLRKTPNLAFEKRCFGANIGSSSLPCDLSKDPEISGFAVALRNGVEKIGYYIKTAPESTDDVVLNLVVLSEGVADAIPYSRIRPETLARYHELSSRFGLPVDDNQQANTILACTRALEAIDQLQPSFWRTINAIGELGEGHGTAKVSFSCDVSDRVGPEYRGAAISAELSLTVGGPIRDASEVALSEAGWDVELRRETKR